MTRARAFWLTGRGRGVLRRETLPEAGRDHCVVRTMFSALSPGTERLVALGLVPDGLREEMRCPYMGGRFPFPVKYGYSLVGRVVAGRADLCGRTVHVLHPHQDVVVVRCEDVRPVPNTVPPARATLASNLETAVTAVWDGAPAVGERALVVGFGIVGSLIARVLDQGPAIGLEIAEKRPDRRRLAESLGFRTVGRPEPGAYDLAFDASGAESGLQAAIDAVGLEGRVVASSWFGSRPVRLDLGGTFHSRRKRLIGSQVSRIPGPLRARWDAARRTELVFRLLELPALDRHVGPAAPFALLPELVGTWARRPPEGLSPLIIY